MVDEPDIRRTMRTTLAGTGYDVDDARDRLREFRSDLVLLDINLPGLGGLAAWRAIRADTHVARPDYADHVGLRRPACASQRCCSGCCGGSAGSTARGSLMCDGA